MAIHHDQAHRAKLPRVGIDTGSERLTEQHHKDSCDATQIVQRYAQTGVLTHVKNIPGIYADLPDTLDYQWALETFRKASDAFAAIPASIREKFGHSPHRFLEAIHDPSNRPFFEEHGFFNTRTATKAPDGAVVVESVPPTPSA